MALNAVGNYLRNMLLSISKGKQLMEDDIPIKELIRRLLESESKFKAVVDKILLERDVAILFGTIVQELVKEDHRKFQNIPASYLGKLMSMKPVRGQMVKQCKRLLEILNEELICPKDAKEIHNGLFLPRNSALSLQGASSVSVTHNHTVNGFNVELEMSAETDSSNASSSNVAGTDSSNASSSNTAETDSSNASSSNITGTDSSNASSSNTTETDSSNASSSNTTETDSSNASSSNTAETESSNGGSSPKEAGDSVIVDIRVPNPDGGGGNNRNPDTIYWMDKHRVSLKISGIVAVKLHFSDVGSRQSSTYRVITLMDVVAFLLSIVGITLGDKYLNFSKGLVLIGFPAAIFVVIASMTELLYPELANLVGAIASLPPLLLLLNQAFDFKEYLPVCMKSAFGFNASLPSSRSSPV